MSEPSAVSVPTKLSKLEALREAKRKREEVEREAEEDLQVAELELDATMAARYGKRGKRWDIVKTTEGPIAVVRGDSMTIKQLRLGLADVEKDNGDTFPITFAFVIQQIVHPSREIAGAWLNEMQGLAVRCQDILIALHRGEDSTQTGKR